VSHARSTSDDAQGDARYAEAQEIRSDAKYKLPAGAHILYSGDWNLFNGSDENAYKCLTGQTTSDLINWADNSAVWANTNQTQAFDPMSKTIPPTTVTWTNGPSDNASYLYGDSTSKLTSRIDIQLMNARMLGVYNSQGGVQLAPDSADPFDSSNFPASQYPYAFETFGNNGTVTTNDSVTAVGNHSLDDLANTAPNASSVYAAILLTGSSTTFTGSDHYPIVGDYIVVSPRPVTPVLSLAGFGTNGLFQFKLTSTAGASFGIQASTNATAWVTIGSAVTGTNGSFLFQDTNTAGFRSRLYRAIWPWP